MLKSFAHLLRRVRADECGAVTVDWVALTAGILVVGLAIVWFIMDAGVDVLAGKIVDELSTLTPGVSGAYTDPPTIGDTGGSGGTT